MILVDTSIWIDHLHETDAVLVKLLEAGAVCSHSMIIGEIAMGTIRRRSEVLIFLSDLPQAAAAGHDEAMVLVEQRKLYGRGLSLVDAHLLAAVIMTPETSLWTRDRRLSETAKDLGIEAAALSVAEPVDDNDSSVSER